jgi:protease-4
MRPRSNRIARVVLVLAAAIVVGAAAWWLFVQQSTTLVDLLGVLLVIFVLLAAIRVAGRVGGSLFPAYNVAEVAVEGPITRDGGSVLPSRPGGATADDVVDQIERADADRGADALLLKLNTPGGEVVPSDDIRQAAVECDGPTVAYTNDMCASGGMWIASGCDELWARDGSIVGSIGVIFAQIRVSELMDRVGVDYEGITSGEYKDALSPFKSLEDDEREYVQALSDAWYEHFVERVAEGTDMEEAAVRDTEARVYLGEEALELDMVDELGTREDIENALEDRLGEPVSVAEFEPQRGLAGKFRGGAQHVAFALGAGVASAFDGDVDGLSFRR